MSELISGKEALIALANGEEVEYLEDDNKWHLIDKEIVVISALIDCKLRLKPRTVNLNGVDVGQLYSSQWDRENPKKVTIEFNTEEEAHHFNNNALKIFNGV